MKATRKNIPAAVAHPVRWSEHEPTRRALAEKKALAQARSAAVKLSTWEKFAKVTGLRIDKPSPAMREGLDEVEQFRRWFWSEHWQCSESQMAKLRHFASRRPEVRPDSHSERGSP